MNNDKLLRVMLIHNCMVLLCTVAVVLGLYAMSNSWHSLWGLLILLSAVSMQTKKSDDK